MLSPEEAFERYAFYHCIDIGGGLVTPGIQSLIPLQQPVVDEIRQMDLKDKTVLDIGCRDGLYCLEAEKQGGTVVGIDNDLSLAALEFILPYLDSKITLQQANLYDFRVDDSERFDLIIFA